MTGTPPFVEEVIEKIGDTVILSCIMEATEEDIKNSKELHEAGNCDHKVVYDSHGWLYDTRSCYTCGAGLGTV